MAREKREADDARAEGETEVVLRSAIGREYNGLRRRVVVVVVVVVAVVIRKIVRARKPSKE